MTPRREGAGRKPAGLRGEKISQAYPTVTIRMPPNVRAELTLVSQALGVPQWRVLVDAFKAYLGNGPVMDAVQRAEVQHRRHVRRLREQSPKGK